MPKKVDDKVEIAAEALWKLRAKEGEGILDWRSLGWRKFCERKPDLANIYRENAQAVINALAEAA